MPNRSKSRERKSFCPLCCAHIKTLIFVNKRSYDETQHVIKTGRTPEGNPYFSIDVRETSNARILETYYKCPSCDTKVCDDYSTAKELLTTWEDRRYAKNVIKRNREKILGYTAISNASANISFVTSTTSGTTRNI
jgi:hypothetical protein